MSGNRHDCALLDKDTSGLPKLAPNANCFKRMGRYLRKLLLMNPNHKKCKELFRNKAAIVVERRRHALGPHFFVIHPLSALNSILKFVFVVVWFYSLIMEPLSEFMHRKERMNIRKYQKNIVSPIQVILIILFFNTGYIDKVTNRIILEPKKIIFRYLLSYFIFDFLSTYTSLALLIEQLRSLYEKRKLYKNAAMIVRIVAFSIRIPTVLEFVDDSLKNIKCTKTLRSIFHYIIKTYLYLHLCGFVILIIAKTTFLNRRIRQKSWLMKLLPRRPRTFRKYAEIFRMVFCYFFGIGHNVGMEVTREQISIVIISFFGRLYTLFLLADILRVFGIAGVSESMYERGMSLMQNYMADQDLPENLRERIIRFFEFKFQGHYFNKEKIINTLSESLRTELFLFSARKMIHKVEVFKKLPNSITGKIIGVMKSETYSPRDIIITIGTEISDIYFISSGTVAVMDIQGAELCHLEDGDEFGTSCLFFKEQIYAVVAAETTEVFIIDKNEFIEFLRPYPEVMNGFYRTAKEKLAKLKHLEDNANTGKVDLLTELQSENILEKRTKRIIGAE